MNNPDSLFKNTDQNAQTVLHLIDHWCEESPHDISQSFKGESGEWSDLSIVEIKSRVCTLSFFLLSQGFQKNEVGLIYASNSPDWVHWDLAFMHAGGAIAGIPLGSTNEQMRSFQKHTEAQWIITDDLKGILTAFFTTEKDQIPGSHHQQIDHSIPALRILLLRSKIKLNSEIALLAPDLINKMNQQGVVLYSIDDPNDFITSKFPSDAENFLQEYWKNSLTQLNSQMTAAIVFTSGTTGESKSACLSHSNILFAASAITSSWTPGEYRRHLSFLPLSHVAERVVLLGMGFRSRFKIYFCSDRASIFSELYEVQPTLVFLIPKLWDLLKEKGKKLLEKNIPDLKYALGISKAEKMCSGSAQLNPDTYAWFKTQGLQILEVYGMSETSGILTSGNTLEESPGTVGKPYPDIEIKIVDDGEILTRGPHLFKGYLEDLNLADESNNNWFATGDVGAWDDRGNLRLLGRKKELIKTNEGKSVLPGKIENHLLQFSGIEHCVVVGHLRPFLAALITVTESIHHDFNRNIMNFGDTGFLVDLLNRKSSSLSFLEELGNFIDNMNSSLPRHERLLKIHILPRKFKVETGELTATLKIRRHQIENSWRSLIEKIYNP